MKLSDKQALFAESFTLFAVWFALNMRTQGYRWRFGYAYRGKKCNDVIGGHPKSTHLSRVGIDIILDWYDPNRGKWIYISNRRVNGKTPAEHYKPLHDWWSLSSPLAAEPIAGDANHFSFEHNGVR